MKRKEKEYWDCAHYARLTRGCLEGNLKVGSRMRGLGAKCWRVQFRLGTCGQQGLSVLALGGTRRSKPAT